MKVALISTEKLPVPPVLGGAVQIYIEGILPYLSKEHELTVFTVKNPSQNDEEIVDNVKYIRLDAQPKEQYIENVISNINNTSNEYDLVHVFNRPKWVNRISKILPNSSFGLSLHNEMFRTKKISYSEAKSCIDRVDYINTVSNFIAKGVYDLYPEAGQKLKAIYSGVEPKLYKPIWTKEGRESRNRLRLEYGIQNYKVILFVGRLCEKKGVHTLLEAMAKVMQYRERTALIIIGSSWFGDNVSNEYTKKLVEISKKLKGPIIFTGFLEPSKVTELYDIADIFVCPSQWDEPLARVHYEAMAAGLPIITTDRGGNAEVVRGNGNGIIIREYNNPAIMASRILYLINSPVLSRNMGIRGRKLVETKFNFKRLSNEILERWK